tara:strand:- start:3001 stop:4392 length:1392 start_codon:yes stop_codon:yes gene_type:complete
MSAVIEISYFNSIVLTSGVDGGGQADGQWHVEESRIKGEFNGKQIDYGARAHLVDEEYGEQKRTNALIHSGIYNSRTKINELNQFPVGEDITRAVDISQGSIQKLHAEDTNLNIFQENKVNRALIDKDAIFTAEGQAITTSGKNVIGQITPYSGKYGIGTHPESFAVFGNRKYFADKDRGVVCRLSSGVGGGSGIELISQSGMKDFFKDNLKACNRIYGAFDEQKGKYIISLQGSVDSVDLNISSSDDTGSAILIDQSGYRTLCYSERVKGWTSFFTYKPTFGVSLDNEFYTFNKHDMYKHHDDSVTRGNFYGKSFPDPAYVKFIFNDQPNFVKTFLTINYEGTTGWSMEEFSTGGNSISGYNSYDDVNNSYVIPKEGTLVGTDTIGFVKKEGFYFSELRNKAVDYFQDGSQFNTTGVKGYYSDVKLQYWIPSETSSADKAELFAVGSEVLGIVLRPPTTKKT